MMPFFNSFVGRLNVSRTLIIVFCLLAATNFALAQRINTKNDSIAFAPAAPPNIDQCENGPNQGLTCNWINGNLNENNSSYIEGQSVAYRIKFTDLTPNSTGNSITIEYDTTENGRHTLDYLTSFNRNITNADPCIGISNCSTFTEFPIPLDPNFAAACPTCTQIPGNFRLYKGTITGVSAYTLSGTYAGTSQTSITITFNVGADPDAVLAWGGHISTRADWGINNSAVSLTGSPYHMRIGGGGAQQDRSLKIDAVIFPGQVTIIKEVQTFAGGNSSTQLFPFTATNFGTANFSLVDNNSQPADRIVNSNITAFGTANTITVTESMVAGWSLSDLTCTETSGGLPNLNNTTVNLAARTASIIVEEGEFVTCTFKNLQVTPTAGTASVSGRVLTETGLPIRRTAVTIFNANTLESQTVYTNLLGYYRFDNLPVNNFYIVTVTRSKQTFLNDSQSFTLSDNLAEVNFIALY